MSEKPTKEELLRVATWLEDTCPIMAEDEIAKNCCGIPELEERTRQRRSGYEFAIEHIRTNTTKGRESK